MKKRGIVVDNFAGGGGASTGIEAGLGRYVDFAVNHDQEAIALHAVNHPYTKHFCEDVWDIDPYSLAPGHPMELGWFSPDCTFHSKARGGRPFRDRNRARRRRGLAWLVVKWMQARRPDVVMLENVEEFKDWGPIGPDNLPIKEKMGFTFRRFVTALEKEGYRVEYRELVACDYRAPTKRKRLFLIARCDGLPIVWPTPTHGPGLVPYYTAADCIDFDLPVRSIFDRPRPLADNTQRRIARGIKKFVIDNPRPYIINGKLAGATLIQTGYGEDKKRNGGRGQEPRVPGLDKPLGTIMAGGCKHALVVAFLAKHNGGNEATGQNLSRPIDTITGTDTKALVTSHLLKLRGTCRHGQQLDLPFPTVTAGGNHYAEVRAFLIKFYSQGGQWGALNEPMPTIPCVDRMGLVTVYGEPYFIGDIGMRMLTPRELFTAQSFERDYIIDPIVDGKPLNARQQVNMCGNAVPPVMAEALVRANCGHLAIERIAA